jgi:ribonuclease HII
MLKPQHQEIQPEAGCDEAGRGCLAGPVFAAAVILPADFQHPLLNDSKKLNEKTRYSLREVIINQAVAWAVGRVDAFEIDQINILNASFKAMHMALESLNKKPGFILVDGNRFISYGNIPHATIIKGDGIYASIAAASILAKTFRDDFMYEQDKKYPQYNWKKNKGYGTADHRKAISVHGYTDLHRLSFKLKN